MQFRCVGWLGLAALAAGSAAYQQPAPVAASSHQSQVLKQYCQTCHSGSVKAGGLVLEGVSPERVDVWEKVLHKVRGGEMPPAGAPRPNAEELRGLVHDLTRQLDAAPRFVGRPVVRRLTRGEYSRAVRDLVALDVAFESELPPDAIAEGFDNIADALSMSPVLLERYLKAARKISQMALGLGDASPVATEYPITDTQATWQGPALPYGSRGGVAVKHFFPRDGDYDLRAFIGSLRGNLMTPVEGVRFFQVRVPVTAGVHHLVVTFPNDFAQREDVVPNLAGPGGAAAGGPSDLLNSAVKPTIDFLLDGRRVKRFEIQGPTPAEAVTGYEAGPPMLKKAEITGPFNARGAGETPSRQRILTCRTSDTACATRVVTALATRAYRRDVKPEDLVPLMATYRRVQARRGFEEGIAAALADVLVSPDFLFRLEFSAGKVSPFELATRLSFFLWSTSPDDELLTAARRGNVLRELPRMWSDAKSETLVENFAAQWLGLRDPVVTKPDGVLYPEFDSALKHDFEEECRLFVRSVLRSERSVLELVSADYTYLNDRLAKVYGIDGVTGNGFRRYPLKAGSQRGGLLGQGYVLLMTSHNDRTSPIVRGKWILQNLFNAEPPPPPAGVPPLDESVKGKGTMTTRQQVELHRKNAVCASCHARMDPLGFALENYDVIGRWRMKDTGGAIDASGVLPNGEVVAGLPGLQQYFMRHSDQFVEALVERLLTYALGRRLEARDQPTVRQIVREAAPSNYRFRDLVEGVVKSAPFQMRQETP